MRDHQNPEPFSAKPVKEVQHPGAHRDVEHRDRLVGDEQFGAEGHACRDRDSLALASGELVRVAVEEELRRAELDPGQGVVHAFAALRFRAAEPMDQQRLLHSRADGEPRVERLVRVLVDQLHPPPKGPKAACLQPGDVVAVELDSS